MMAPYRKNVLQDLSNFQHRIAHTLLNFALDECLGANFSVIGDSERYVRLEVAGRAVFIYEDAFEILSSGRDYRFEKDDIESMEAATITLKDILSTQEP